MYKNNVLELFLKFSEFLMFELWVWLDNIVHNINMSGPTEMFFSHLWSNPAVCKMPHRAPGSSPPQVGLATRQFVPGAGIWWGRQRSGLTGAGWALRHSTVLLCWRTIIGVTLASIDFLVIEVDAQYQPCRFPLATSYWALKTHTVDKKISHQ